MKFKVKDNNGEIHISKDYTWNKMEGIPIEELILEDMERCDCMLNEGNPYCEGDCIRFDEGEVIEVINN